MRLFNGCVLYHCFENKRFHNDSSGVKATKCSDLTDRCKKNVEIKIKKT